MRLVIVTADVLTPEDIGGGFQHRYWAIVAHLISSGHSVRIVYVNRADQDLSLDGAGGLGASVCVVEGPPKATTRLEILRRRLLDLALPLRTWKWTASLERLVEDWNADLVVALTPFNPELVRGLAVRCPLVLFAEEDFSRSWDSAASCFLVRGLFAALGRSISQRTWPTADYVVIISERERKWAELRFQGAEVRLLAAFIDQAKWREEEHVQSPIDILAIGEFNDARNAHGMRSFLRALDRVHPTRRPLVHIASRFPPHLSLRRMARDSFTWLGAVPDGGNLYARAALCLVPAFAVSGAKNQVLQGWYLGCPVVATQASANSVSGVHGVDLLSARTAEELVDSARRILADPGLGHDLARAGRRSYAERHSAPTLLRDLDVWLRSLT